MKAVIQQNHFRNGQLREKTPLKGGQRHGVSRKWHRNGTPASEESFKNGLLHGRCRQWDESGKLLGEFTMNHGTGVQREWHENGQIKIEVSTVNGTFCGRNRIWLRDGTLFAESFYLDGVQVTPLRYGKAAAEVEDLPQYAEKPARLPRPTRATELLIHENFVAGLLEKPDCEEGRVWFEKGIDTKRIHSLGRFCSERAAVAFIESLYEAGAAEVVIPGVFRDTRGNEYADNLLVQLPKAKSVRVAIRQICVEFRNRSLGVTQPERDIGESRLCLLMG